MHVQRIQASKRRTIEVDREKKKHVNKKQLKDKAEKEQKEE